MQNFASNADRQAICRALIALARKKTIESLLIASGIELVAEGVETIEKLECLFSQATIRLVQWIYCFKPVFIEQLELSPKFANRDAKNIAPIRVRA